jgi:hypothetical protein
MAEVQKNLLLCWESNLERPTSSPSPYEQSYPCLHIPFSIRQIFYTNSKSKSTLIEFETLWNEAAVGYFKAISQRFPDKSEENHEKLMK